MSLVAIIVSYNRLEHLKKTIEHSLAESALAGIFVVDNASDDGTAEWLAQISAAEPRLHAVSLPCNSGGSGGFSHALQAAPKQFPSAQWFVLYDDDAYPQPGAFAAFMGMDKAEIDSAAAAVYYPDGRICEMNRPSFNPFWHTDKLKATLLSQLGIGNARHAFHIDDSRYQESRPIKIDSSSFVGFFIRRDWITRLPPLDPRLFIYGDDILYTLRLTAAGGRHYFLPGIRFSHDTATMQQSVQFYQPAWKGYFHYRNLMLIYRLAAGRFFPLVWPLKIGKWLLSMLWHRKSPAMMALMLRAAKDGIRQDLSADPQAIINQYRDLT